MHARKAWLDGLSPRENRDIPPLDYDRVYRLKKTHPDLHISINGGIGSIEAASEHLRHVDGVMMGRAAYQEPWQLLAADPRLFGADAPFVTAQTGTRSNIPIYRARADARCAASLDHPPLARHCSARVPGARAFRRHIAVHAVKPGAGIGVLREALDLVMDTPAPMTQTAAA